MNDTTSDRPATYDGKRDGMRAIMREASFEDYGQIAALQARNGLATRSYDDWIGLWRGNPAYQESDRQCPIGWVLEIESGEVIGSIGNIPLAYEFRGRPLRAATAYGWVVDAAYRGYSTSILSRFMKQNDVNLFVFATVSSSAEPVYNAFGLSRVPVGTWHKSSFWITNYRGFARSALGKLSFPWAKVFTYPVSAGLYCVDTFRHPGNRLHASTSEIEPCSAFDERFDHFWEELKRQDHDVLLAVRTRETLAWHFGRALSRQRAYVLAASQGSRLTAYAIFDRQDNLELGLKRVRLVDFQALRGSEDVIRSALLWMLHKCRQEGIHILEVMGDWLTRVKLPPILAPYHRTLSSWAYYYKANDRQLSETLRDPHVWAPSSFDGDASL